VIRENQLNSLLIVAVTPYFLERENFWIAKNLNSILRSWKTQPFWRENIVFVQKDQPLQFSEFLRKLDELGYEKVFKVEEMGEFSQRGGIVDVFPVNLGFAVRVEFLGNKVENIEKLHLKVKDEKKAKELLKKKLKSQKLFSDLKGLKKGDYLVHLDHGIGVFEGVREDKVNAGEKPTKYYVLGYAGGDKLFVPFGLERKLSRYYSFSPPSLSRLGTSLWQRTKRKVKAETEQLAKELLGLFAQKELSKRAPLPEGCFERTLEATFEYELTPDQQKALQDINDDFLKEKPMDRLICGDVGFGKTEIALRAAVRVAEHGKQVAFISPTAILASQHFNTFSRRLKNLPIEVRLLSRLQKKKEQKKIVEEIKKGQVDIVIGTHRILSRDVEFKNLGLLIIDDEQKFGVKAKEKLRKSKVEVDVLSLSATPIPRTLYMSLAALRDISLIQTPPLNRKPVKVFISLFKESVIKEAIANELQRGGQIYFLHNRVETIPAFKKFLEGLKTGARIGILHGRLKEKEIVKVMNDFQQGKTNLLLATTIIENGLDLPQVNTLLVDDATKLGLSQAYQLKGRIGRGATQAFAYFFYPKKKLTPLAKKRLKALKENQELGSGFKVAKEDMEIRGAGNILGKEQSGNINRIGLNLYCQMLSQAVNRLSG
jgi:transcription-repair coupling factor (superfamily II helicase)